MISFPYSFSLLVRFGLVQAGGLLALLLVAGPVHAQTDGISVGTSLSQRSIQLTQGDGRSVAVRELGGDEGTVVVFWSHQCPWTDRYEERLQKLVQKYQGTGIQFVLVNSNDFADSSKVIETIQSHANRNGYRAPYVRDSNARFAEVLGATRTPQVFVFDDQWTLQYKGAIDDSPSGASQVEHSYLENALEALLAGDTPDTAQTEAFGCTLKYPE